MVIPSDWPAHPFCYLTTTGRRSGKSHRIEIWYIVDGRDAWLFTERDPETDWVRNLRVEPAVTLEIAGRTLAAHAAVIEIALDDVIRKRLAERYASAGDDLVEWASEALAVRVSAS